MHTQVNMCTMCNMKNKKRVFAEEIHVFIGPRLQ